MTYGLPGLCRMRVPRLSLLAAVRDPARTVSRSTSGRTGASGRPESSAPTVVLSPSSLTAKLTPCAGRLSSSPLVTVATGSTLAMARSPSPSSTPTGRPGRWESTTTLAMNLAVRQATFAAVPIGRIRRSHIEAWVKAMASADLAPGTIKTATTTLEQSSERLSATGSSPPIRPRA